MGAARIKAAFAAVRRSDNPAPAESRNAKNLRINALNVGAAAGCDLLILPLNS
jgi:hypothetical protein